MQFVLKQLFSLILPFTVLIIVPLIIENNFVIVLDAATIAGILFAAAGLAFLAATISMFIRLGRGTLAPWSPTNKLVVSGLYSHVRNPMITGVLTILLGESLVFHSILIFSWLIVFFICNNIYFTLSEEPGLIKRFGEDYLEYKSNVPRWIPKMKPWGQNNNGPEL